MNYKIIYCVCFLLLCPIIRAQQEVMYSQYMYNMLNVNPAYAGIQPVNNITALYRKQWVNVEGAPTTGCLSWDSRKVDSNVGYGVQLYNDKLGIETSTGFQVFYSYRLLFNKSSFVFGISAGAMDYRAAYLTGTHPTVGQGVDPSFQEDINAILPTAGIGCLYSTDDNWYIGLSAPALLKTKIYSNNYQVVSAANHRYFLTAGYLINASSDLNLKIKPSVMLKVHNGEALNYDINFNVWFNNTLGLGISYRSNDALVGMVEFQIGGGFTLGYAYDYLTSNLKTYSSGTHELMIRYELPDSNGLTNFKSLRYY